MRLSRSRTSPAVRASCSRNSIRTGESALRWLAAGTTDRFTNRVLPRPLRCGGKGCGTFRQLQGSPSGEHAQADSSWPIPTRRKSAAQRQLSDNHAAALWWRMDVHAGQQPAVHGCGDGCVRPPLQKGQEGEARWSGCTDDGDVAAKESQQRPGDAVDAALDLPAAASRPDLRIAGGLPRISATWSKGSWKTSCGTKATRSAGLSRCNKISRASLTSSSKVMQFVGRPLPAGRG
jgi:hypothetical protein